MINYLKKFLYQILLLVGLICIPMTGGAATSDVVSEVKGSEVQNEYVTFTVTRKDASAATIVNYRTLDGSAVGGIHFEHQTGQLYFKAKETTKTVKVKILTPNESSIDAYGKGNTVREFKFVAWNDFGEQETKAVLSNQKSFLYETTERILSIPNVYITDDDKLYISNKTIDCFNSNNELNYIMSTKQDWKYYYYLTFDFLETVDGYFTVGISNTGNHGSENDTETDVSLNGNLFAAKFENTATISFPACTGGLQHSHRKVASAIVYTQHKNTGDYIVSSVSSTTTLYTSWQSNGKNDDKGNITNAYFNIKYVDLIKPTASAIYCDTLSSYSYGDQVTIAVRFDEIVETSSSSISTNVGTFSYAGGSGTNVLYYSGTLEHKDDATKLSVRSISGTIKDLAGNVYSGFSEKTINGFYYKYSHANAIGATPDIWNKSITLTWNATNVATADGEWRIYRYKESEGPSEKLELLDKISTTRYEDNDKELNYETEYVYFVQYVPKGWSLSKLNTDRYQKISTSLKRSFSINMELTSYKSYINIKWESSPFVGDLSNRSFQIYRKKKGDNLFEALITGGIKATTDTVYSYDDNSIDIPCAEYSYYVASSPLFPDNTELGKSGIIYYSDTKSGSLNSSSHITGLDASKGMYAGTVKLQWTAEQITELETGYNVYRRELGKNGDWNSLYSISGTQNKYSYDDNTALSGKYYQYKVESTVYCSKTETESVTASLSTDGFSRATGVVSGRVTYGTGTAVNGAKVSAILSSTGEKESQFYSLYVSNKKGGLKMPLTQEKGEKYFVGTPWSIQLYVNPNSRVEKSNLICSTNNFGVYLEPKDEYNYYLGFVTPKDSVSVKETKSSLVIPAVEFTNITFSYDGKNSFTLCCVNKEGEVKTDTCVVSSVAHFVKDNDTLNFNNLIFGESFQGYIDEVRVFSGKKMSQEDILKNYNHLLSGTESNLVLYWPLDEGINNQESAYDYSKTSGVANNNHGSVLIGNSVSSNVPSAEQLSVFDITDENGNYTINGIPFVGEGSTYMITPTLGIHKFSPTYATRFVSASSLVHSGVDFEDVSSFPIHGQVTFFNTDYPVEGAYLYVDGTICSKDGEVISTNANGEFTISVPIGEHFITVKKDNHVFVNEGRYPANPNTKAVFDREREEALLFYDSTFVTVTGRVAGGYPESQKLHGFGLGKATIGKATIELYTGESSDIQFNLDPNENRLFTSPSDSVASTTTTGVKGKANVITIHTDSATGEFAVSLPPVDFMVKSVKVDNNKNIVFSKENIESILLGSGDLQDETDSLVIAEGDTATFTYRYALDLIHRSDPVLKLTSRSTKDGAFGDEYYIYQEETSQKKDTIPLYTVDSITGAISYTFGYPLFTQGKSYEQEMYLYEPYVNYDSTEAKVIEIPLEGAEVEVSNSLGATMVAIEDGVDEDGNEVKDGDIIETGNASLIADSLGKLTYKFQATYPNIVEPYTLGMEINYIYNGDTYKWNDTLLGIVSGGLQTGSNFITAGPDKVLFVLRDPPGTGSSAYLEKGQTITTAAKITTEYNSEYSSKLTLHLGAELKTSTGIGVAVITDESSKADASAGFEITHDKVHEKENTYTLTTTENISTSDAMNYVGEDGDIFMGTATNIIMGKTRKVAPTKDTAGNYSINMFDAISLGENFTTQFKHTQNYIENVLIPNLEETRNSYLKKVSESEYNNPATNTTGKTLYITTKDESDDDFGAPNTYKTIPADPKNYSDTISYFNLQISKWKVELALNEAAKVMAIESTLEYNDAEYKKAVKKFEEAKMLENTSFELFDPYVQHYVKLDSAFWFNKKGGLIIYADYGSNKAMIDNILDGYEISRSEYENYLKTPSNKRNFTLFYSTDKYGWKVKNVSFDSGSKVEESVQHCGSSASTDVSSTKGLAVVGVESGFQFCGLGFNFSVETKQGGTESFEETEETENCTTIGYSLAEDGDDDALTIDIFQAPDGFGPIFHTRAGQTSCPYESEKKTKYFEPGKHTLATKTMQIEYPRITVGEANLKVQKIIDIPSGSAANFTLNLDNLSETSENVWYRMYVVDESNSYGAALSIDGVPFSTARPTLVNALETTHKNLQIKQSRPDIMKYDSIAVVLASDCQYDGTDIFEVIADTVYLSVEFVPSCSPVTLQIEDRILNSDTHDTLHLAVKDYEKDYLNFSAVKLQYKGEHSNDWSLFKTLTLEELSGTSVDVMFPMNTTNDIDQTYQFRAVASCTSGTNTEITNTSDVIEVIKDMERPQILGNPNPSDGILEAGDEISVTFNEDIRNSTLSKRNITVQGVLNDAEVDHNVAMKMDSTSNYIAATEADILLANKNFAVDMWVNLSSGGTLLNHASSEESFTMSVDDKGKLTFNINGNKITSSKAIPFNKWCFLTFCYSAGKDSSSISSLVAYDDEQIKLFTDKTVPVYNATGKISIGKNISGAISEMALWNTNRSNEVAQTQMYYQKAASTEGLIGYWKFDEGHGSVVKDVARSRHMAMTTDSWYLNNTNYAAQLDGKGYVSMNIEKCPALTSDDYVVEMWFRGDSQKNATLWSANQSVALKFNNAGHLTLLSNGYEEELSSENYLDNVWHHIALNVLRNGMTTVYVDGSIVNQVSSAKVAALSASRLTVGAQCYVDNDTTKYKDYFKGNVDEVRYWLATLNEKTIDQFRYMRLNGDEAGLQAYYTFEGEKVDAGQTSYVFNLEDNSLNAAGKADAISVVQSSTAPALQTKAKMRDIDFSFVASERTITITLNKTPKQLEGSTINFTVSDVRDLNNNKSLPVTWSAYINQNRLIWVDDAIALEKDGEDKISFVTSITNQSASKEAWAITGLPSWLTASKTSGSLGAQKTETITFNVSDAVAIGKYEETLYLSGNEGINVPFTLSLKVTKNKPNWSVDPTQFEGSMSLLSQLKVDGKYSEDSEDLVAAFINGKCVGVASPVYYSRYDAYFVSMDIYGNANDTKKDVLFKAWDASTGVIYPALEASENIAFESNTLKGSMKEPILLSTASLKEQTIDLKAGWNWISLNVKPADNTVEEVFGNVANETNLVKSQSSVAYSDGEEFMGTLSSVNVGSMYKTNMLEETSLSIVGQSLTLSKEKVTIAKGWNWMGYNCTSILSLNQALAGLDPKDGDLVKGQTGFAYYEGYEWVGTLTSLVPGAGYMYYSTADSTRTFTYPSATTKAAPMLKASNASKSAYKTVDVHSYSGNMTVVAVVNDNDTLLKSYEVGVFAGKECRAAATANAKGLVFLTIAGDAESSIDSMTIKVMAGEEESTAITKIAYSEDANYGSLSNPFVIYMQAPSTPSEGGSEQPGEEGKEPGEEVVKQGVSISAVVMDNDSVLGNCAIGAFVDGKCVAAGSTDAKGKINLVIKADSSDLILFKMLLDGQEIEAVTKLYYAESSVYGSEKNPFVIQMNPGNAVKDITAAGISVYPTLVETELTVKSTNADVNNYTVLSLSGVIFIKADAQSKEETINVSALQSGEYILLLETSEGRFTQMFSKK